MIHLHCIEEHQDEFEWEFFRQDIDIFYIYQDGEQGASAALLRYAPAALVPQHEHLGFEHILILSGDQTDGIQTYHKGSLMISRPDSRHSIISESGCIVLGIWLAPVKFTN